ncbi:hypothetical protein [Streptomyces hygroscopicus]|uniref:hypothetical protein n=1 Tax=Streptomyces hygroscopicus TaxID=1912 RepID=UPI000785FB9B|nr:hypothetical protein [Streptomyces hygroscopicus]
MTVEGSDPEKAGPGVVVALSAHGHPAAYSVRTDMTLTGSGWVASVALVPESAEAGYDDLPWRCGWEPYIFQGLPSVDPDEIGHAVDEKRARQILRVLAADGILQRLDTDRAVYRLADDPEQ